MTNEEREQIEARWLRPAKAGETAAGCSSVGQAVPIRRVRSSRTPIGEAEGLEASAENHDVTTVIKNGVSETQLLLEAISRASWHGRNLRGSTRGLSVAEAAWRPSAGRHNIWELVLHAAYAKYVAWRRLSGSRRGTFALRGLQLVHPR